MTESDKNKVVIEKLLYVGEMPVEIALRFKMNLEELLELMEKNDVTNIRMRVRKE